MLTIEQTAKLLRVSERTLHNWEAGRVRIPYAAYKLIRILRGYELPGDAWKGYRLIGDTLWSPENLPFHASDARWWSLTVQMAHEYRRQSKDAQARRRIENGASAKVENRRKAAHVAMPTSSVLPSMQADSVTIPAAISQQIPTVFPLSALFGGDKNTCSKKSSFTPVSNTGCSGSARSLEFAGGAA